MLKEGDLGIEIAVLDLGVSAALLILTCHVDISIAESGSGSFDLIIHKDWTNLAYQYPRQPLNL